MVELQLSLTSDDNNNIIVLFDFLDPTYASYISGKIYDGILSVYHPAESQSP